MEEVMDSKLYGAIQFRVLKVAQRWQLSETEHADLLADTVGHVIQQKLKCAAGARVTAENFLRDWQKRYFNMRRIFRPLTPTIAEGTISHPNARNASEAILRGVRRVLAHMSPSSRKIVELFWELGCPSWVKVAEAMGIPFETFRDGALAALRAEYIQIWKAVGDED